MRSNWPAFEAVTKLVREPAGYGRGAFVGGFRSGWFPLNAEQRAERHETLDKLRAELFNAQQKSATRRE